MTLNTPEGVATEFKVSRETMKDLEAFVALTLKWNPKINLIGNSTIPLIWSRHIADSLQLLRTMSVIPTAWIDIGSGGGYPGMIIAIALKNVSSECRVTMIDSDKRKTIFLKTAARELSLNVEVICDRIQNVVAVPSPVISARALAPLKDLLELAHPLLSESGHCLFQKGSDADSELTAASESWNMSVEQIPSVTDPNGVILKIGELERV